MRTRLRLQVFNNLNFEGAEKHTKGVGKVHVAKDEAGRQVRIVARYNATLLDAAPSTSLRQSLRRTRI